MRKQLLLLSAVLSMLITLSACHSMPEHAKFIPKDATGVLSVDVTAMGKKIAWSAITGSKIFDEWKARPQQKDAVKGLDKAGIDYLNTLYLYTQKDDRFGNDQKIVALLPLDDATQWETFLKSNFPAASIKDQGKRKEAAINENSYAGWDKHLLVIVYATAPNNAPVYLENSDDSLNIPVQPVPAIDAATFSAEMEKAFNIAKDNMLVENKHFTALQKEGHDIAVWVNYEAAMSDYMTKGAGSATGLSFSNSLWKDAALTAGLDFNKGAIKSDMKYYMPVELQDIGRELGAANVDKEMVEKLPTDNLDMITAMHLSPKGIKAVLEKTGLLGLVNVGLASQNLSVDDVLNAFSGDMGFAMNNFNIETTVSSDSSSGEYTMHSEYTTRADYVYVLKINKKENFEKLLQLAVSSQVIHTSGNNTYTLINSGAGAPVLIVGDKYAVVSNNAANANAYLSNKGSGKLPELAASSVKGHPLGMYIDIQQMVKNVNPGMENTGLDSAMLAEAKKLLDNIAMSGGEFKNNAFQWSMSANFMNKEENSLIQILNFAIHFEDSKNKGLSAYNGKMY